MDPAQLRSDLKRLIVTELNLKGRDPETIEDDAPLFGAGLGLDSLDALQLAMSIEEKLGVRIPEGDEARAIFRSVRTHRRSRGQGADRVKTRLWVTGLGLVTPLGTGVEATWARLVRGDRAVRPITLFDVSGQRVGIAAEVEGVRVPGEGWSRTSAMAATAAEEAMRAARIDVRRDRVGLVVGGTTGGMFETEQLLAKLHAEPECREVLAEMLSHPLTATGDRLDERLGPFARIRTLSSACSSGANALVVAAAWLLAGEVDAVVAGAQRRSLPADARRVQRARSDRSGALPAVRSQAPRDEPRRGRGIPRARARGVRAGPRGAGRRRARGLGPRRRGAPHHEPRARRRGDRNAHRASHRARRPRAERRGLRRTPTARARR